MAIGPRDGQSRAGARVSPSPTRESACSGSKAWEFFGQRRRSYGHDSGQRTGCNLGLSQRTPHAPPVRLTAGSLQVTSAASIRTAIFMSRAVRRTSSSAGGHNIDPGLIEDALLQSPEVLLAAAVGKPDEHAGELPVAYVQLVAGSRMTGPSVLAHAAARIPERAAIPKAIFFLDKMPLTDTGKPAKVRLRHDAAERTFRTALSQLPGLATALHRLEVTAGPHALHGTLVTILLTTLAPLDATGWSLQSKSSCRVTHLHTSLSGLGPAGKSQDYLMQERPQFSERLTPPACCVPPPLVRMPGVFSEVSQYAPSSPGIQFILLPSRNCFSRIIDRSAHTSVRVASQHEAET